MVEDCRRFKRTLEGMKFEEGKDLKKFLDELDELVRKYNSIALGKSYTDKDVKELLYDLMPESFLPYLTKSTWQHLLAINQTA